MKASKPGIARRIIPVKYSPNAPRVVTFTYCSNGQAGSAIFLKGQWAPHHQPTPHEQNSYRYRRVTKPHSPPVDKAGHVAHHRLDSTKSASLRQNGRACVRGRASKGSKRARAIEAAFRRVHIIEGRAYRDHLWHLLGTLRRNPRQPIRSRSVALIVSMRILAGTAFRFAWLQGHMPQPKPALRPPRRT